MVLKKGNGTKKANKKKKSYMHKLKNKVNLTAVRLRN